MIVIDACKKLNRNIIILLCPILYDVIALTFGVSFVGFYGKDVMSIRMILEMGMPSVSHLSNIPLLMNDIGFLSIPVEIPFSALVVTITVILLGALLRGGYIGCLAAIAESKIFNFKGLVSIGLRNWIQFIILELILLFGKIGVTAFLALFFGIIGVFASLVIFITLRIIFVYLEFTMVVDRVGITGAIKKSRNYLMQSLFSSLPLVVLMYIVASLLSLFLHRFWSPVVVIIMIAIYAYMMSVIQLLLMKVLIQTKEGRSSSIKALFT